MASGVVEAIHEVSFLYLDEAEWDPGKRMMEDGAFAVWRMRRSMRGMGGP